MVDRSPLEAFAATGVHSLPGPLRLHAGETLAPPHERAGRLRQDAGCPGPLRGFFSASVLRVERGRRRHTSRTQTRRVSSIFLAVGRFVLARLLPFEPDIGKQAAHPQP